MKSNACPSDTKRSRRFEVPLTDRAGYTPRECAGLFGRAETWGYRRIWDGTFKPVSVGGRMLIPRSQVEELLATAKPYAVEVA